MNNEFMPQELFKTAKQNNYETMDSENCGVDSYIPELEHLYKTAKQNNLCYETMDSEVQTESIKLCLDLLF